MNKRPCSTALLPLCATSMQIAHKSTATNNPRSNSFQRPIHPGVIVSQTADPEENANHSGVSGTVLIPFSYGTPHITPTSSLWLSCDIYRTSYAYLRARFGLQYVYKSSTPRMRKANVFGFWRIWTWSIAGDRR